MRRADRLQIRGSTRGLTLLELAVVLAIIGVIAAGGTAMLTASIQTSQYNATVARMQAIEAALLNFRIGFTRLPCPGDLTLTSSSANYGLEADAGTGSTNAVGSGTCTGGSSTPAANFAATGTNTGGIAYTVAEGSVPTRALRLPDSYMYDGWGNKFRYAVDAAFTATNAFATYPLVPGACAYGGITVKDSTGAARSSVSIYALISHGANGHGAYTNNGAIINGGSTNVSEQTNCSCSSTGAHTGGAGVFASTFVQQLPATTTTGNGLTVFDDIVDFRERWQMQAPTGDTANTCTYIYFSDGQDNVVRRVTASTGIITTVAGNGTAGYTGDNGPATSAKLNTPWGLAVDSSGNLYIGDYNNNVVRKVNASTGIITTVAGNGTGGYTGNGGAATSAELHGPVQVAVDSSGNIYIADDDNDVVRKVNTAGTISTYAGIYNAWTYGGDNGPAASADLSGPWGIAVDSSGNLYITDYWNNRLRKVNAAGTITTVAGNGTGGYTGNGGAATSAELYFGYTNANPEVAVDSSGNLYIGDYNNDVVREVNAAGTISAYAGIYNAWTYGGDNGPATSASLNCISGVSVDSSSNLYIADLCNNRIRKVAAATGIITTIAGTGTGGYTGDGGPATNAEINHVYSLVFR